MKLKFKFEVWSWSLKSSLKLKIEVDICSWRKLEWKNLKLKNFKLKKFEIEEIWSWGWQQSYLWKEKSNSGKKVCLDGVNVKTEGNMGKENGN